MLMVVVLPAPFGPSRPYVSPARISNPTPSTAWRVPKCLRRSRHVRTASVERSALRSVVGGWGAGPAEGAAESGGVAIAVTVSSPSPPGRNAGCGHAHLTGRATGGATSVRGHWRPSAPAAPEPFGVQAHDEAPQRQAAGAWTHEVPCGPSRINPYGPVLNRPVCPRLSHKRISYQQGRAEHAMRFFHALDDRCGE
jgi:hypothetical protein